MANVQLKPRPDVRRVGHGITAPRAVAQDELDVLARAKGKRVIGGQLQLHHHHVGRFFNQAADPRGHFLDGQRACGRDLARFEHDIALRCGAAGQHKIGSLVFDAQGFALEVRVHHLA